MNIMQNTKMKKFIFVGLCLHLDLSNAGGIPVFDAASNALQTADNALQQASWMQQAQDMATQIMTLRNQYDQLRQQYQSMTGTRGMSELLNNSTFQQARRTLPPDAQQILGLANGGSYGNLGGMINSIKQSATSLNTSSFNGQTAYNQWNTDLNRISSDKALSMEAYNDANQRLQNIETMIDQISQTEDPKAIEELQARISAENAIIQNEHAKLQALAMLASAEKELSEKRDREISIKTGSVENIPRIIVDP
jgi:type IV secretion system protein VirB5